MKKFGILILINSLLIFSSCIHIKNSYVIVTVVDSNGNNAGEGIIVYMMPESPNEAFGESPTFAELSMATDMNGQAEFLLKPSFFIDDGYTYITKWFTIFEKTESFIQKDSAVATTSVTIHYGDTEKITLKLK